jgi:hypothetical protein
MRSQSFFVRTGDSGVASYQVIIPVLNLEDGYSIQVKAADGTDIPYKAGESGEYVIDREEGPGQFKATVAIVNAQGTVCDERLVEISCSKGTDPLIMQAVVKVLEKQAANAMTDGNAFSDVHAKARGEDIAAVCEQYFRDDVTADWRLRCLAYLHAAVGSVFAKNHVERIMGVINHALGAGESVHHPSWAVSIGLRAKVPPPTRFSFLFRALQCSFPSISLYQQILSEIANITPSSERPRVAAVASELFAQHADYDLRIRALNLIVAFGYRKALPVIRDVLTTNLESTIQRELVQILLKWDDTTSAPQLMEMLELTNDSTLAVGVIQALKQFGYRDAIPKIEAMIPVSGVDKARVLEAGLKGWK